MISFENFIEIYQITRDIIKKLTDNQKETFLSRAGLIGKDHTFQEVSEAREVSRTRVKQVETLVLKKIYDELEKYYDKPDMEKPSGDIRQV